MAVRLTDPMTGAVALVAPQLGFNCFSFVANVGGREVAVIDAPDDFESGRHRASRFGIPLLFPFPNRIRDGRYVWEGTEHLLPLEKVFHDPAGHAIHGFCLDRPWRVAHQDGRSVTARFQLSVDAPERRDLWPADFLIEARYRLSENALRLDVLIRNPDRVALPWGFGTHPYFRVPLTADGRIGDCTVEAPVSQVWETEGSLPTGRRLPIPEEKDLAEAPYVDTLQVDDVYTGLRSVGGAVETLLIDERSGLEVAQLFPDTFRELVAFTPPGRDVICLEPYTCATDAINLASQGIDAGWRALAPGGELRTWIELEARLVIA